LVRQDHLKDQSVQWAPWVLKGQWVRWILSNRLDQSIQKALLTLLSLAVPWVLLLQLLSVPLTLKDLPDQRIPLGQLHRFLLVPCFLKDLLDRQIL
jgi:hypothetical protein